MEATIDGARIWYDVQGPDDGYPIVLLHGGPGLDHTEFRPWFDSLAETYRLIYVDQRGQGRSERVDPSTLTLSRFAADATQLAAALGLNQYALLGHSYGAMVALVHAIEQGDAAQYIISSGSASMSKSMRDVEANLAAFEPGALREQVKRSWALEPLAKTQDDARQLVAMQWPFHFASVQSEAYRRFVAQPDQTVYAPDVLAYTSEHGYTCEFEDQLGMVRKPTLIITGQEDRTCTPRAAREMAAGILGSELLILPDAGHQTFIEQPERYFAAVRSFLTRHQAG